MNCYDPLLEYEKQCEYKNTYTSDTNTPSSSLKTCIDVNQYTPCTLQENTFDTQNDQMQDCKDSYEASYESTSNEMEELLRLRDEFEEMSSVPPRPKKQKKSFGFSRFLWHWTRMSLAYFLLSGTIFGVLMGLMNFSAYSARVVHWIQPEKIEDIQKTMQKALVQSTPQAHAGESEKEDEINREVVEEKILIEYPDMVFDRSYNEESLLSGLSNTSAGKTSFSLAPKENRIIIPRIGKNIPLVDVEMKAGAKFETMNEVFMEELKKGVVRYPGTAKPGQKGNAFIFGHSSNYPWIPSKYNNVFALLDKVQNGDKVIVYYDGKKYIYKITDRAIVKPGDVKVLRSRDKDKKEIALMTCWPIGTTLERIIIFGSLVEES
ncbi:hypothetical protein CSB09_04670 [Candidatus Gracilibacteria bacterium]|nr:MAG: hypothetical protein CSB09_04670 [Candidatus Gracilibacteria bacterium]